MKNIAYICNRQRCGDRCSPECNHTTDIKYAANFKKVSGAELANNFEYKHGKYFEIERSCHESKTTKKAD